MKNKIENIFKKTVTSGGYTSNVRSRYIVGLENGYSKKIASTDYNQFYNTIDKLEKNNISYGTWYHENIIYIDENIQVNDFKKAVKLGKKHHQIAIFDISKNEEIKL